MDLDQITLGQLKQLKALFSDEKTEQKEEYKGTRIVILQRGWIYVGRYYVKGIECRLEDAYCVRRWGTTMGLGELAEKGPLPETKLEKCPLPITFHRFTEVASLGVCEEKWAI